jgi:heterodisulfide reductase subunit C
MRVQRLWKSIHGLREQKFWFESRPYKQKKMKDFGFSVIKQRSIDFDQFDGRLLNEILQLEPSFKVCISCGGCTATCSAGDLISFNVRQMNLLLRRGEIAGLDSEIKKCMLCGKCMLVCPRGINIRNVIMLIKKSIIKHKPPTS